MAESASKPRAGQRAKSRISDLPSDVVELSGIEDRQSGELVIALVGAVGSGVTKTAEILEQLFTSQYRYSVDRFKISELIEESARLIGCSIESGMRRDDRIAKLQECGTKLRGKFGEAFLAEKAVERIALGREMHGGYSSVAGSMTPKIPVPRRVVHIIDSLKNPAEEALLRSVYGSALWVVGVFAPYEVRRDRMLGMGLNDLQLHQIMNVDEEEAPDHGQKVRKTVHLADFFVRNDQQNDEQLHKALERYFSLVFNIGVQTPTRDENAMFMAASESSNSACLSRQVGAAIVTSAGELIGVGANDVPKAGGGLYGDSDGDADHRCFKWGGKICHNDEQKGKIYEEIARALADAGLVESVGEVEVLLRRTRIKDLIEFSRAVHAEMEAIISVARGGKGGIVGGTLYSTTFPCHSCARHLVAAGIDKVVYIEPYTKSLAANLHSDAISLGQTSDGRVQFLQYEGVATKNMLKLFRHGEERKVNGALVTRSGRDALPVFPTPLDGFSTREQIVVGKLRTVKEATKGGIKADSHEKPAGSSETAQLSL